MPRLNRRCETTPGGPSESSGRRLGADFRACWPRSVKDSLTISEFASNSAKYYGRQVIGNHSTHPGLSPWAIVPTSMRSLSRRPLPSSLSESDRWPPSCAPALALRIFFSVVDTGRLVDTGHSSFLDDFCSNLQWAASAASQPPKIVKKLADPALAAPRLWCQAATRPAASTASLPATRS